METVRDGCVRPGGTIVFSDIDGTLLTSDHRLTPRTRRAIERIEARGIPFVIVTARGMQGVYPLLDRAGIRCPVIAYSGGVMLDQERRVIAHRGFTKAQAAEIAAFVEAQGHDITWSAYAFEDWVAARVDDARLHEEERIVMARARQGTIASIAYDEVHKFMLFSDPAITVQAGEALSARFPRCSITCSSNGLIEIVPEGVTKAHAVRELCSIWGVDPARAIAFGDSRNDLGMLEAVGEGYLMGNAPVELKARFPRHTDDNDHDGIYTALAARGLIEA